MDSISGLLYFNNDIVVLIVALILLSIINVMNYVPTYYRMMFRRFDFVHHDLVSDVPGNIFCYDRLIITQLRNLPEPNNLDLIQTRVPYENDRDLLVKGKSPNSVLSSITVYEENRNTNNTPITIELADGASYEILVTRSANRAKLFKLQDYNKLSNTTKPIFRDVILTPSDAAPYIIVAMRNYLVPNCSAFFSPMILEQCASEETNSHSDESGLDYCANTISPSKSIENLKVIRKPHEVITGMTHIALSDRKLTLFTLHSLFTHVAFYLLNANIFMRSMRKEMVLKSCIATSVLSFITAMLLYDRLTAIFQKRLNEFIELIAPAPNKVFLTDLSLTSKGTQPSQQHVYYCINAKVPAHSILVLRGKIAEKLQRYWSCVMYDKSGVPISQSINMRNVIKPSADASNYEITLHLVNTDPTSYFNYYSAIKRDSITVMNLSQLRARSSTLAFLAEHFHMVTREDVNVAEGYLLFRLVHPTIDARTATDSLQLTCEILPL